MGTATISNNATSEAGRPSRGPVHRVSTVAGAPRAVGAGTAGEGYWDGGTVGAVPARRSAGAGGVCL